MAKITDKDNGYKALMVSLVGPKPVVHVGILEAKGAEQHENSEHTVAEIASFHEFGLGNNPERSFIRGYCDEQQDTVLAFMKVAMQSVRDGKYKWDVLLERVGLFVQSGIQKRISDGIPPPLKEATIKRKTRDGKRGETPLINTGQLRAAISFAIRKPGE